MIRFQKEGLNCSVSTDDPGIMITTLLTDYHIVTDEMGLSVSDLKEMVSDIFGLKVLKFYYHKLFFFYLEYKSCKVGLLT